MKHDDELAAAVEDLRRQLSKWDEHERRRAARALRLRSRCLHVQALGGGREAGRVVQLAQNILRDIA